MVVVIEQVVLRLIRARSGLADSFEITSELNFAYSALLRRCINCNSPSVYPRSTFEARLHLPECLIYTRPAENTCNPREPPSSEPGACLNRISTNKSRFIRGLTDSKCAIQRTRPFPSRFREI